jgi:hypothetical protein
MLRGRDWGTCVSSLLRRARCYGSACVLLLPVGSVRAQEPAPSAPQVQSDGEIEQEYQQVVNAALSEYERGSWEESTALFQRAHQLRPSARTLRGLGLASYEARRYPESIRYLGNSLTDTRRPLTPKQREEVEATLARARLFVGYLQLAIEPSSAVVAINGQRAQADEQGLVIANIGWLDLEVRAPGYETVSKHIRLNTGEQQTLALRMLPDRPPAEPPTPIYLPAPALTLPPVQTSQSPWKYVATGTSVLALAAGTTFLILQKTQAPRYTRDCVNNPNPGHDCQDRSTLLGSTFWTGSILGFSIGGGLVALSVVLFALDTPTRSVPGPAAYSCSPAGLLGMTCRAQF